MIAALAVAALLWLPLPIGATPSFQGMGAINPLIGSSATAVSADGRVMVGNDSGAFRWTAETGMQTLWPGGSATDISADGSTVVGSRGGRAVRWTESAGAVELGTLPGGDLTRTPTGVSGDGSVIVGTYAFGSFRWTASDGAQPLPGGRPEDISDDGQVVVGSVPHPVPPPFGGQPMTLWARWTEAEGWQGLPEVSTAQLIGSLAHAASADGSIVVGRSENIQSSTYGVLANAVSWSEVAGTDSLLPIDDGEIFLASQAFSVSADGSVIVGMMGPASLPSLLPNRAFIWDAIHGVRFIDELLTSLGIDLAGWTLDEAVDVSDDGLTIVGNGSFVVDGTPSRRAWIAVIPEPTTGALLGVGLAALGFARTRRRGHIPSR